MRNYADVPNLHARIHAMRSRLFTLRDYILMIREPETLPGHVSGIQDPTEAKETLFGEQIAPVFRLATAHEKYTPFFIAHLRQYEAHNAKILLAMAAGHRSFRQWYDIGPFAALDRGLLEERLSLDDVKSLLADLYQDDAFRTISGYRQLVVHLDDCTARNLYRSAELLSGAATEEFREMMLKRLAVMILIWSYRLGVHHRFPQDKIRFYMDKFQALYGGKAWYRVGLEQEALAAYLEQRRKDTGQEPSVAEVEHYLEQTYYAWIARTFHRDFHSICCVVSYLWLLYYQIRNLFRIIDGRRYGLGTDAIIRRMICEA
ncbi:MAG TPA: V-type ATPase subunit [Smithellaceae bacterium]|nr:V-type ATPase subunit [Smithellaceae bacterium]HRS82345.1 V-type ATPase subunit [Smithellaceae bacterium]HRV43993.1 V-type ATPase subunit [Smithellaceae bacterium]